MIFQEILQLLDDRLASLSEKYNRLYALFIRMLEEQTLHTGISFSGPFPRMTYVCKDHDFSETELYRLNRFRVHCLEAMRNHESPEYRVFLYDVKALAQSAAHIYGEPVPDELAAKLPHRDAPVEFQSAFMGARRNLRLVVDSWDEQMQRVSPDNLMPQSAVRCKHQKSRIGMCIVSVCKFYAFAFLCVYFEAHHMLVKECSRLRSLEHFLAHPAARSAPRGIDIHE